VSTDPVIKAILVEMERVFDPVIRAGQSGYQRRRLLAELGWEGAVVLDGAMESAIRDVGELADTVVQLANGNLDDFGQLLDAIQAVGDLINAIETISEAAENGTLAALSDPQSVAELAEDLFAHLLCTYLIRFHPWAYLASIALTLIDPAATPRTRLALPGGQVVREPVRRFAIVPANIPKLFEDPVDHLTQFHFNGRVDAAGSKAFGDRFLAEVASVLALHGYDARYGFPTELAQQLAIDPGDDFLERMLALGMRFSATSGSTAVAAELDVSAGVLGDDEGGPALVIAPSGEVEVAQDVGDWTVSISIGAATGGIAIGPGGIVAAPVAGGAQGRVELELKSTPTDGPAFLFGPAEGTRLELGSVTVGGGVGFDADGASFDLLMTLADSQIVVAAGDGDSFLKHILPPDGFRVPFEFGVGFESPNRVYFFGGAGLDVELPVDIDLFGVIKIPVVGLSLYLTLPEDELPALRAALTATVQVDLGPFFATVEGMGLAFLVTFPPDGGNAGPVQIDVGFQPPRAIGMRIAAGPVVGGGYIYLDVDKGEYAGVLQVKVGPVGLTIVGLLTTRMPDGSDGFSLMLIVSFEMPPIQLGYGFTLNGAGGMLGVNRTVNVPALQDGVRRGALDSILFPKDAVTNARQIIADVGAIFPPASDQFVIGPMVKLGWGTGEPMITAAVGIVIEFPRFTISLLGLIEVGLPALKAPVLLLRLGIAGILDPGRGELSVDATLFGSYVTVFSISGEMALRARWKDDPIFAMAVGGFHPQFDPPSGFPQLNRLAIALADSDNPRVRLEAYMAFTPAAVMFGARLDAYFSADFGPVGLFEAELILGFDALIRLSPLSFEVDIYGHANLRRNGKSFCGVDVTITLAGPSPWLARGTAVVHFLGEHTVRFEAIVGEAADQPAPPAIDLAAEVRSVLGDVRTWSALPPADTPVIIKTVEPPEGSLYVHPAAELVIRQGIAPLGRELAKAGESPIAGDRTLRIDGVYVDDDASTTTAPLGAAVEDRFAPSQFFEMSDHQKLTAPQFEKLQSGVVVGADTIEWGATSTLDGLVEDIVIDAGDRTVATALPLAFVVGITIDAVTRSSGLEPQGRGVLGVALREPQWAVAEGDRATAAGLVASSTGYSTWIDAATTDPTGQVLHAYEVAS
jgi:hypothetical protein